MSALSVQPPYPVFTDIDGQPLDGGYIWLGLSGLDPQTNPTSVYWDPSLSIPAGQPVRTLAGYPVRNGTPACLYVNGDYSVRVVNKKGSIVYAASSATERYNNTVVNISLDSEDVIYTPPSVGGVTRTAESKFSESVSVKDFGAVGNGVADDTLAIQRAIDSITVGGGTVFIPKGTYQVTSITLKSGVTLQGVGAFSSVIRTTSATATVFTMQTSSVLRELKILSSVTRTGGLYVDVQSNGVVIDNCEFGGYYIGVNVGTVGGSQAVNCLIKYCEFRDPEIAAGSGSVQFMNFSNAQLRDCVITGPALPATQPDFGIRVRNGDTAFISGSNITLHGKALLVDLDAASNCYALTIDSSLFDSAGTITGGSAVSCAEINPAGGVWNTKISNTWFGLSQGAMGFYMGTSGSGVVDGITFTGCEFTANHDCGLIAVGAGVKNWIVTGGHSGGNINSGIRVANGSSYFSINGHRAGNIAGRGANNIGITVDAGPSNNYIIEGCNVTGNASAGIFDAGTGTSASVVDNLGYNGTLPVAAVTVGASPWSYTAGHTPETLYFAGGTVSEIRLDGQIVQSTTGATIQLAPNHTAQVTYSSVPTVMRKRS